MPVGGRKHAARGQRHRLAQIGGADREPLPVVGAGGLDQPAVDRQLVGDRAERARQRWPKFLPRASARIASRSPRARSARYRRRSVGGCTPPESSARRHRRVSVRQRRVQLRCLGQERLGLGAGRLGPRARATARRRWRSRRRQHGADDRPRSRSGRGGQAWSPAVRGPSANAFAARGRPGGDARARRCDPGPETLEGHARDRPPTWRDSDPRRSRLESPWCRPRHPDTVPSGSPIQRSPRPPWHVARPPISLWLTGGISTTTGAPRPSPPRAARARSRAPSARSRTGRTGLLG